MKHLLRIELARREALAVAVFKQLIHFRPCFAKTPEVEVGTCDGLFLLPQGAVPERGLMHALPFEPLVAFSFRLLPGIVNAHRDPRIFVQHRSFDQQRMHDRKEARALEIIPFQVSVVRKQEVDIRVNVGRPGSRSDTGIDLAGGEEIELGSALRNTLQLEPSRSLSNHPHRASAQ